MKEVTYEDWQKNPAPRMMWVWNSNVEDKVQAKVIYVLKLDRYPVVTDNNDVDLIRYKHCAEIEKSRRMTNKELAHWLREKPTRELKYCSWTGCVYGVLHAYDEDYGDDEAHEDIRIREDDGEWHEPLVEVEE